MYVECSDLYPDHVSIQALSGEYVDYVQSYRIYPLDNQNR